MTPPPCPHAEDAAAWIAGELRAEERAHFGQHLAACAACRHAVAEAEAVLGQLRLLPPPEPARDLLARTLHQTRLETAATRRRHTRWQTVAAAAAMVVLSAGASLLTAPRERPMATAPAVVAVTTDEAQAMERALDWFCRHQEADGSWSAEKWGGNPRFETALTALPLMALLEGPPTPAHVAAADRATRHLLSRQRPDGSFGGNSAAAGFVHGISTLALLHACQHGQDAAVRRAAGAAVRAMLDSQQPSGAWAQQASGAPAPAVTRWHRDALALAVELGWTNAAPALARADVWLGSQTDAAEDESDFRDFHHAYFTVASLRASASSEANRRRATIRRHLLALQTRGGDAPGTWDPTDQWSLAGGRLYTTALASLSLR